MAQCISPFSVETKKGFIPVPCGKCYDCLARRISGWSYRLVKEAEVSSSAFFITLSYDNENVPITKNKFMTVKKTDVQKFFKRLRKLNTEKIKYYCAAEYGTKGKRPHYHIIMFNVDIETVDRAWTLGRVHSGSVTEASVGYTLKYISKKQQIPTHARDDREPEFSLMSKRMGANYVTPQMVKFHKADLKNRMFITIKDGKKIAMPRYYKDRIYTQLERQKIAKHMINRELKEYQNMDLSTREKKDKKDLLIRINKARKFNQDMRLIKKL